MLVTSFLATLLLSSCGVFTGSTTYSDRTRYVTGSTIKERAKSTEVDVDFSRRVTSVSSWQASKSAARAEAVHQAIVENQIDVVVDPIWKYTYSPMFNREGGAPWQPRYKAELVGYAGMYKNAVSFQEELEQLKDVDMETIEKYRLLNDPSFPEVYYNKDKCTDGQQEPSINGSVIFNGAVTDVPVSYNRGWQDFETKSEPAKSLVVKPAKKEDTPAQGTNGLFGMFSVLPGNGNALTSLPPFEQGQQKVKIGKGFVGVGTTFAGIGLVGSLYHGIADDEFSVGLGVSAGILGLGVIYDIVGLSYWVSGNKQIKTANMAQAIDLNYSVSPGGVSLAVSF